MEGLLISVQGSRSLSRLGLEKKERVSEPTVADVYSYSLHRRALVFSDLQSRLSWGLTSLTSYRVFHAPGQSFSVKRYFRSRLCRV